MDQQQRGTHHSILSAIERLENPRRREERHLLLIYGYARGVLDRRSLEYMVNFLDNNDEVTELVLDGIRLVSRPSPDGGVNVLRSFFARSDTTLTKVNLRWCDVGSQHHEVRLLASFHTNRTVVDLTIRTLRNLSGAALGTCLSGLLQSMPQVQRLECTTCALHAEGVRQFQPALQANRTLKDLNLSFNLIRDEGSRLLADSLGGNTTMEVLVINWNNITSNGLVNITRLIESTQLKTLLYSRNLNVHGNNNANLHFITTLHKNTTMQKLQMPGDKQHHEEIQTAVNIVCSRNQSLAHADLLLAPLTLQQQQQQQQHQPANNNNNSTNTSTIMMMWIKTCHRAIAKLSMAPNNAGASAIYKLLHARPALLEKRLKRPATQPLVAVAASRQEHDSSAASSSSSSISSSLHIDNDKNNKHDNTTTTTITNGGQKRRRL